jgi:hypothetical protein
LIGRAGRAIAVRPDAWVDPRDSDEVFMQAAPRERSGKLTLETAADGEFAKLDAWRREFLFEGDRERYRIPGQAITGCRVEKVVFGPAGKIETCGFLSVICAQRPQDAIEIVIGQRAGLMHRTAPTRRQWAED